MTPFTAAIIGAGSLAARCAELWRKRGHQLAWLVAGDEILASQRGDADLIRTASDLTGSSAPAPVDFLFSIVNGAVLPPPALRLGRRMAINFHDGPLPRYAGVHATSWAILAGEQTHGVTWHVLTPEVDAGPVLKQRLFAILRGDTALHLDATCHELGFELFAELVDALEQGTAQGHAQDGSRRTYFGRHQKARGAGLLDLRSPADALARSVAAHTLREEANRFGVPKLLWKDGCLVPVAARALPSPDDAPLPPAGVVLGFEPGGAIRIATGDGQLAIGGFRDLQGRPWVPSELAARQGIGPGHALELPSPSLLDDLTAQAERSSRHEADWVRGLAEARGAPVPVSLFAPAAASSEPAEVRLRVEGGASADELIAAMAAYVGRFADHRPITLGLTTPPLARAAEGLERFLCAQAPLTVAVDPETTFSELQAQVEEGRALWERRGPALEDCRVRYAALRGKPADLSVAVAIGAGDRPTGAALTLVVPAGCGQPTLRAGSGRERLTLEALQLMGEQLATLLDSARRDRHRAVRDLELLRPEERDRLLRGWNTTRVDWGEPAILARFARWVQETPGASAVVADDGELSYSELDARADALARHLADRGVTRDSPVAVALPRSAGLVTSLIALLKLCATYVPLDPDSPPERASRMIEIAGARHLLCSRRGGPCLPRFRGERVELEALDLDARREPLNPGADPHIAYVMFTSGSTGAPKGVLVPSAGLGNRLYWSQATYPIGPGDAILQNAAVGFDISVWEMLFPLLGGARLCVAPAAEQGLVVDLWSRMQRHGVTFLHLVPSVLRELLRETSAGEPPPLRHVVCGGEILPLEVCRAFKRRYLTARLHHAYGPTEASISVTHWEYEEGQDRVLLGKPIANAEIYVLDERQQPVPPGVAGELYIGGLPLARGYAGAPEATRERFVPNPFAGAPGPRLYRTGDRGRWRSDGALEFLGRLDDQIKLRGHRIEPGEIEGMLSTLPNVREAAVRAHRPEGRDEPELVAYVASDGEVSLQPAQLRADLSKVFPPHMIPTRWVLLDALPRLPNGKLDRAALPRPAGRAREADGREPRSELERAVARTWESLLGVERVFADDDFFVLGGHSLLAARLLTWARERFGARLSLRTVFDHPTLAAFAGEIASASREAAPESGGPLTGTERWPLSPAQRRLWFFHELLGDERGLYNIPLALRLRGALDANALGRAFSALQARHPILRARFHGGGSPHMTFAGPARLVVRPRLERRADASPPSCEELLGDRAFEPFDLAVEPPIRAELVPLSTFDHVLALVVHHIAFDEGSARVFLRELGELYQSEIQARPSRLSPLARHYGDLAAALLAREASPETAESLAFWAAGLAGLPKEPPLPRLSARASRTYRGARLTALVPPAVAEAARRVGEQHRATLFMVLLAAFQVALYRISGEEDVVVGTPLAGRDEPGADALVGLFINMAAVRVRLAPERTFAGALAEVRERVLAAMEHGRVSFDRVVDHLGVPRELGAHPVFEVLFALRDDDAASGAWGELQYELRPIPGPFSMYDLALTAAPGPGGIELELEYSTDLLDPALAAGLGAALVDILEYVTGSPLAPIGEAPLVSAAGEAALRAAWRGAELATAGGGTCLDLFLAQADRAPDALALLDGQGGSRSYAALAHDARASASALAAAGVRPGDIVLLALDRSAAQVAAVLGAWAAGAGYAPVSPDDPPARIASVGRQTRAALAVAAPALAETLRSLGLRTLTPADLAAGPGGPLRRPCADDIAYVIYTSGSSGEPKGVQIEHRALANYVSGALRTFELGAGDRLLQFAALSFDASAEEIFTTLASGAALVLRDDEMLRSPAAFFAACEARGVTALDLPTSFFHHLVGRFGASPAPLPSRLRLVVVGGERLLDPYVRAWRAMAAAQGKRIRLLNTYGPTETTIVATAADVTDELSGDDQAPIGRPVPNAWVAVLDALGHPVPPGVPGELWIGGAGLARGYLGRADLTAERFVSDERHGRRYRTGDRVRSSADGLLSYIGRADRQVKVRGFRVELDEIDRVLLAHPSVADAASVHEEGGEPGRIVAYVVASAEVSSPALRQHLARSLPAYMLPTAFVRVESLPRAPSGKIDKARLAPAAAPPPGPAGEDPPPRSADERAIAALFAELLRAPVAQMGASFFELGGHSLLALDLVEGVRARLGVQLPVKAVFRSPTIEALAAEVSAARAAPPSQRGGAAAPPTGRAGRRGPLSATQEGILAAERLHPREGLFNIPWARRLRGPLDVAALSSALTRVLERHESLRTAFVDQEGCTWQVPQPARPLRLTPEPVEPSRLDDWLTARARAPFDLEQEPLLRGHLAQLGPDDGALLVVVHHAAADGWSLRLLEAELGALYREEAEGRTASLAAPPGQYLDLAAREEEVDAGPALAHYAAALEGIPPALPLPWDSPPSLRRNHRGRALRLRLPPERLDALRAAARAHGTTPFVALAAAWAALLSRLSGERSLILGAPSANRADPAARGVVGPMVNLVPLQVRIPAGTSWAALLAQLHETTAAAREHESIPFRRLLTGLGVATGGGHHPLFQVSVDFEETQRSSAWGRLRLEALPVTAPAAWLDLALAAEAAEDGLTLELRYAADALREESAERWAGYLDRLLAALAGDAPGGPDACPLADEATLGAVLSWSRGRASTDPPASLAALVEAQAARTPDAWAVLADGACLRYGELERRASHLAGWLVERGVARGAPVAVHLDRGAPLVVAILAVWKAGGVYVPLDPAQPEARRAAILDDSGAELLLGHSALPALGAPRVEHLWLDLDWGGVERARPTSSAPAGGGPAYLLYTSGSTGRPKGVCCPHSGIARRIAWSNQAYSLGAGDAVLALAAVGFDISLWEIFAPLVAGGRAVLAAPDRQRDMGYLVDRVEREGVTGIHFVPSLLELFLEYADLRRCRSLRFVVTGGERLAPALRDRALDRLPARLFHAYGPTEASISVTHWECTRADPIGWVPLGRPIDDADVYVLDGAGRPAAPDVPGEIHIGGPLLALGYHRDPALTGDRFVSSALASSPRLYRSGDRARWRSGGVLEFLGRADEQVKIRGVRVELGEVEAALAAHAEVKRAAVTAYAAGGAAAQLCAHVVLREPCAWPDHRDAHRALRAFLRQRLPSAMIPAFVRVLPDLPMLSSGKVDRRALASAELPADRDESPGGAAGSPAAQVLLELLSELLGGREIDLRDDFFQLGGDSITAMRLAARARARGLELPIDAVFSAPTLAELATRARPLSTQAPAPGPSAAPTEGRAPATPAQQDFLSRPWPAPNHHNQSLVLAAARRLDPERLRRAIHRAAAGHESFRLRMQRLAGGATALRLCADLEATDSVAFAALPPLAGPLLTAELDRMHRALDLERGPLARLALVDSAPDAPQRLLAVCHHLAIDAVSWSVFLADIEEAYGAAAGGPAPAPSSLAPWIRAAEHWTRTDEGEAERRFWLSSIPEDVPPLPLDFPGGDPSELTTESLLASLDPALTGALSSDLGRCFGARVEEAIFAAAALAVRDCFGLGAVRVAREGHGRRAFGGVDASRLCGWLSAVHPVHLEVGEAGDVAEALLAVKERLRAIPHGGAGFGALLWLGGCEPLARLLRAELRVNYLGAAAAATGLFEPDPSMPAGSSSDPRNPREMPLEIIAAVEGGRLTLRLDYGSGLLHRSTVERFAAALTARLEELARLSQRGAFGYSPSDFPLVQLDARELRARLGHRRGVEQVYPLTPLQQGFLVHHLRRPESRAYLTQLMLEVRGPLEVDWLEQAWREVARHHAVLRTAFDAGGREPLQIVYREVPLSWALVDLSGADEASLEARTRDLVARDVERPFRLDEAPLSHLTAVRLSAQRLRLLWTHHHILLDGWSLPLILRDVAVAYGQLSRGSPVELTPSPSFADYVRWLRRQPEDERFWREALADLPPQRAGPRAEADREAVAFHLTAEETRALARTAEAHRWTLNSLVVAVCALVAAEEQGHGDVTLGVTFSVRPREIPDVERLTGLCMNTLPLRLRLRPGESLAELFDACQAAMLQLAARASTPLAAVQRWAGRPGEPLFDAAVVFENYPGDRTGEHLAPGVQMRVLRAWETTEYPLVLTVLPGPELGFELTCAPPHLGGRRAAWWTENLLRLLRDLGGA